MRKQGTGWRNESRRHSLARKGIRTAQDYGVKPNSKYYAKGKRHEFADELSFWTNSQIKEFEKKFGEIKSIVDQGSNEYWIVTKNGEFRVFENYEDAEEDAQRYVLEMLEGTQYFNQDWLNSHLDWDTVRDTMEGIYDEWNSSYAYDIEWESDDEYDNRLIKELVEYGIIDENQAKDQKYIEENKDLLIQKFANELTESQLNEGRAGLDHFEDNFGKEQLSDLIRNNNFIDFEKASEDAVYMDGVAHFIAGYDGVEHMIGDAYIYQTN